MEQKKTKSWNIEISFGVSKTDILIFTKNLSVSLKSGLTLVEALDMLYDQANGRFRRVLEEILDIIRSGQQFHKALEKFPQYFSPIYVNLIKAGEISGNLEQNLNYLAEQLRKSYELNQKIRSAMIYPTFVFVAVFGLAFAIAVFVLPKILPLFKTLNVELPIATRALIFIAEIFQEHGALISFGFIGFVFFLLWFLRRDFVKPVTHRMLFYIPIVNNIVRNVNLEQFSRTLGTLLASGIPVDTSLLITADTIENYVYKKAILSFISEIQKGNNLSEVFLHYPQLFPKIAARMIGMGEKTGNLDHTLQYLSEFYEREIDTTMRNLSNILEPILLIVIGLVVGTVAIAILGPIYKITGNLRN